MYERNQLPFKVVTLHGHVIERENVQGDGKRKVACMHDNRGGGSEYKVVMIGVARNMAV